MLRANKFYAKFGSMCFNGLKHVPHNGLAPLKLTLP